MKHDNLYRRSNIGTLPNHKNCILFGGFILHNLFIFLLFSMAFDVVWNGASSGFKVFSYPMILRCCGGICAIL